MSNTRHVVVLRKDLQLPVGLAIAQGIHASDQFMRKQIWDAKNEGGTPHFAVAAIDWFHDPYISILAVNCLEDLHALIEHAEREGLQVEKWEDIVPSPTFEDKSIRALVGISIGPDDFDKIKIVTGSLPLYN